MSDDRILSALLAALSSGAGGPSAVQSDEDETTGRPTGGFLSAACPVCKTPGMEAKINGTGRWHITCPANCHPAAVLDALRLKQLADHFDRGYSNLEIALWIQSWGKAPIPLWNPLICLAGKCSVAERTGGVCFQPGKHPHVRWKDYQSGELPQHHEIQRWWKEWPEANIGLLTGRAYNLAALDCDDLPSLEWCQSNSATSPIGSITGLKSPAYRGRQFLFSYGDLSSIQSRAKLRTTDGRKWNLDVRGDGGLIVFPGSLHPTGVFYERSAEWPNDPFGDLPAFPRSLFPELEAAGMGEDAGTGGIILDANGVPIEDAPLSGRDLDDSIALATAYLNGMGGAIQGNGGDQHTYTAAAVLVNDFALTFDQAWPIFIRWNHSLCQPAWSEGALRQKLENAEQYAKRARGNKRRLSLVLSDDTLELIQIFARTGHLPTLEGKVWDALRQANVPSVQFLRYAGMISDVGHDDHGIPRVRPMSGHRLRSVLGRVARWFDLEGGKGEKKAQKDVHPPLEIALGIGSHPEPPLPILHRVIEAPFFAPNGRLCSTPGYNQDGQAYYWPRPGFKLLDVPTEPTAADIQRAVWWIDELLCDFPFVPHTNPANRYSPDRANAIALLLLPFARDLIAGSTPLHLIEAPEKGTGKGLLAKTLLEPALGRPPQSSQGVKDDPEEWKKQLASIFMSAPAVILFDNLEGELKAGPLASALTEEIWSTRLMRENRDGVFRVRSVWACTANNLRIGGDMGRRIVRIRLDAHSPAPWERTGFRHSLPSWGREHRPELVHSALTIIQSWLTAGKPAGAAKLGSYEDWAAVMSGILAHVGIRGFLENAKEVQSGASDRRGQSWAAFLRSWWLNLRNVPPDDGQLWSSPGWRTKPAGVKELLGFADGVEVDLGDKTDRGRSTRLGCLLSDARDRCFRIDVGEDDARDPTWLYVRLELSGAMKRAAQYRLTVQSHADVAGDSISDRDPGMEG